MKTLLRSASMLALASIAISASAQTQVLYTFSSPGNDILLGIVSPTYVTADTRFTPPQLSGAQAGVPFGSAGFFLTGATTELNVRSGSNELLFSARLQTSWLTTPGVYPVDFFGPSTFTTSLQAVPEPATMAALGLGAVAMLRRRKRS